MAKINPINVETVNFSNYNYQFANIFGEYSFTFNKFKGINTTFTCSVSRNFYAQNDYTKDKTVALAGNTRYCGQDGFFVDPTVVLYADDKNDKRISMLITEFVYEDYDGETGDYVELYTRPSEYGAYYGIFKPCVGTGISSDERTPNIYGIILEYDIETDTSLIFMMHDVLITNMKDPYFYKRTLNDTYVDYEYGTRYMRYSIGIFDHVAKKFQHFLCENVPITTLSNGTWQHGWHQERVNGETIYVPNDHVDGTNGWEKDEFCKRFITVQKWIENDIVSYSIKSVNISDGGYYYNLNLNYVDNGDNHYITATEPQDATLIVALDLDGVQSGMNFNHPSVLPFLKFGETRNTFYRPWGLTQFEKSGTFANVILPGIYGFYGRIADGRQSLVQSITGKRPLDAYIDMPNYTYGNLYVPSPEIEDNDGYGKPKITYAIKGSNEFTSTKPTTPGEYTVKAVIPETEFYLGTEITKDYKILKPSFNITVSMASYDTSQTPPDPVIRNNKSGGAETFQYKLSSDPDSAYITSKPTSRGNYVVKATVAETETYQSASATANFTVTGSIQSNPVVSINDWVYGNTPSEPIITGNTGNGTVTYEYKASSEPDSSYTITKPTSPGNYIVKASIAAANGYDAATVTDNFSILKGDLLLSLTMGSYQYGKAPTEPILIGNIGNGAVTYEYKIQNAADSTYVSVKPTEIGMYTVKATVSETSNYNSGNVTANFSIIEVPKIKIEPAVSLRNFHIDELTELLNNGNVPIPTVTNNLGNAPVKFMYKRKSRPSTEYTNVFPNDIGAYDIKAYIHESNEYSDAECFGTFSIYNPNVDERDGTTVVSVYSNVEAGNVTDIDTKLYAEYKKNSDTIKDKMSLFTIDSDNRYKVLLQGAVNNANEVTIESSISAKIDFIIEKCVIMGDRIICYTDSRQPSYHVANDMLPGTAFTQMAINTQEENDFIIENMPDGHYGYIDVPIYEQYPIMSGSEITSYDYRRIDTNKVLIDNGYAFDRLNSTYYALPEDIPVFSSDEVVITKSGWNISPSGVCRQILTLPLKHIKDYFPNSRIYYETQTTI